MHPFLPKISVILCTYNRPAFLDQAVASVLAQDLPYWELLVINDGGMDVGPVLEKYSDSRIRYLLRPENKGKAACCNFGLSQARGAYIAYIDDDDLWYPNHLRILSDVLDRKPELGCAYSDLYSTIFAVDERNGHRYPLHKSLKISRNFNRDLMFGFNHVLHVSLMHRKDAALHVGGYDEKVRTLIEWDLNRKLSFIYDFEHVQVVTGEYMQAISEEFGPIEEFSRSMTCVNHITENQWKGKQKYRLNQLRIKADLPPEPWPRVRKVEAILPIFASNEPVAEFILDILEGLDYPSRLTMVCMDGRNDEIWDRSIAGETADFKNVSVLHCPGGQSPADAYRYAAERSDAEFLILLTDKFTPLEVPNRILRGIARLDRGTHTAVGWDTASERRSEYDYIVRRDDYLSFPDTGRKLNKTFITQKDYSEVSATWSDLHFEALRRRVEDKDWAKAKAMMGPQDDFAANGGICPAAYFATRFELLMKTGEYKEAERLCRANIAGGYEVENYFFLGRCLQKQGFFREARDSYTANLQAIGLRPEDLHSPVFPFRLPWEVDAFGSLVGIGECHLALGELAQAEGAFKNAIRLWSLSHKPYLGLGRVYLKMDWLDLAEQAFNRMAALDGKDNPEVHLALGELCERRGNRELAAACYRQAFDLDPELAEPETLPVELEKAPAIKKVGRNATCPCGSGRKYKKCCGKSREADSGECPRVCIQGA